MQFAQVRRWWKHWTRQQRVRPVRSRPALQLEALEERLLLSLTTQLLKDINPTGASAPSDFLTIGQTLYFVADDGVNGRELWKSDGTVAGTVMVADINVGGNSSPAKLTNLNGILFFAADDGLNGVELWKSDGTAAGTVLVKDINPGATSSYPKYLTAVGATLFFAADDGLNGVELWKSNGTSAGTLLVSDIQAGGGDATPQYLTNVGGVVLFVADDGIRGKELWKSNGTSAGTVLVKDISPEQFDSYGYSMGNYGSDPQQLINVGGVLFFSADNGARGRELWKSDGTAAGTQLVRDIHAATTDPYSGYTYNYGSDPTLLTNVNGILFFSADDGIRGRELWKSDGTLDGTVRVEDIAPGDSTYSSYPQDLRNANGVLYFSADNNSAGGGNGRELWRSNGTSAGTFMVKDINAAGDSDPNGFRFLDGLVYFSADDGASGAELWSTNGTAAGTTLVRDIQTGSLGSDPKYFTVANGALFFVADDGFSGAELWVISETINISAPAGNGPDSFTLHVNGANLELVNNGTSTVIFTQPLTDTKRLVFAGADNEDDTLIIDYTSGFFKTPVLFAGGAAAVDTIILQGGTNFVSTTHSFGAANAGGIDLLNGVLKSRIDYIGHEAVTDDLTTATKTFAFSTAADAIVLADDAGALADMSAISSATSPVAVFTSPTATLLIQGNSGDDTITLSDLDPAFPLSTKIRVFGQAGADLIDASALAHPVSLDGGAGNDTLHGSAGNDTLVGGLGKDRIVDSGNSNFTLTNTKLTGPSIDLLVGIEQASLTAGSGNDKLIAAAFTGSVTLVGGDGNDSLVGGAGSDVLSGGLGDDTLKGGLGSNRLVEVGDVDFTLTNTSLSGLGADVLTGIQQASLTVPGASTTDHTLNSTAFAGKVTLVGGGGNDTITAGKNSDFLSGGAGNNSLTGGLGSDRVFETADSDFTLVFTTLQFLGGGDILNGIEQMSLTGLGSANIFTLSGWSGPATVDGGGGNDRLVLADSASYSLANKLLTRTGHSPIKLANLEQADLTGGLSNNVFTVTGWTGLATLTGGGGTDKVVSAENANFILSDTSLAVVGRGTFTLSGISQAVLTGGKLNNTFDVSGWTQSATLNGSLGKDTVISSNDADFTLSSLKLTRSTGGTFALVGIEKASLTGGPGANVLNAAAFAGAATLDGGGAGADLLKGGAGSDTLIGGIDNDTLLGNAGNDLLTGDLGDDSITGGTGINTLVEAGDGNFTLTNASLAGVGADILQNIQRARLTGGASVNVIDASAFTGQVTIAGGGNDDSITGAIGASVLLGEAGNDDLTGGNKRDLLVGGTGVDTLDGGGGDDILIGGPLSYDDEITSTLNLTALSAVMAEWTSITSVYAARVAHLLGTLKFGRNGPFRINSSTVSDDASADSLTGATGRDWFVADADDTVNGRAASEKLTTI